MRESTTGEAVVTVCPSCIGDDGQPVAIRPLDDNDDAVAPKPTTYRHLASPTEIFAVWAPPPGDPLVWWCPSCDGRYRERTICEQQIGNGDWREVHRHD